MAQRNGAGPEAAGAPEASGAPAVRALRTDAAAAQSAPDQASAGKLKPLAAFWRGLAYFGVYLLTFIVVEIVFSLALLLRAVRTVGVGDGAALLRETLTSLQAQSLLLTLCVNLAALLTFWILFRARRQNPLTAVGMAGAPLPRLAPLILLGLSLNVLITSAFGLLPESWLASYSETVGAALGSGVTLFSLLAVAVLAPLTEEVVFRGLIYRSFRRGMRVLPAMLLSSALFGVMHGHPLWMVYAALIGMMCCFVTERAGTLAAPVVLHVSFNLLGVLTPLFDALPAVPLLAVSAGISAWMLALFLRRNPAEAAGESGAKPAQG